jgi:hypothetical protein
MLMLNVDNPVPSPSEMSLVILLFFLIKIVVGTKKDPDSPRTAIFSGMAALQQQQKAISDNTSRKSGTPAIAEKIVGEEINARTPRISPAL